MTRRAGRALICLLLLLAALIGRAQGSWIYAIGPAVKKLPQPEKQQAHPLEPAGFPNLPGKEGALPAPRPYGDEERIFEVLSPTRVRNLGRHVSATGGIHARYKGYDMYGSTLEGDRDTEVYTLTGDVKVIGQDSVVTGQQVTVFMKDRSFRAVNADAQLSPSFLKGRTLADVYTRGGLLEGTEKEVHSHDGGLTTCDLDHPHFEILADYTEVRPGHRIILHRAKVQLFGHTVLSLPYLSIPLDQRDNHYLPDVGQSQDEGYYIKFNIPIALRGNNNFLDAKVAYMTKLGTGLGGDFDYRSASMYGNVRVRSIIGPQSRTFEFSNSHTQNISDRFSVSMNNSLQRQNYLSAPENTTISTTFSSMWQQNGGTTGFTYTRSSNESDSFSYLQQNLTLTDTKQFRNGFSTDISLALSSNRSSFTGGTPISSEQLDVNLRARRTMNAGLLGVEYKRTMPIGENQNFFGSPDRTPVLSFETDSQRWFGKRWVQIPVSMNFSVGEFTQPGTNEVRLSRGYADLAFAHTASPVHRFGVDLAGQFRQAFYSDDTAQYVAGFNGVAHYRFGAPGTQTGINVRYNFLRPHGFTPFEFDRSGEYNLATMDVTFDTLRTLQIGAQTGYDFQQEFFQQTAWQSLGLRAEWKPTDFFSLRGLTAYDPFAKAWSNVRLDLAYNPGATTVGIGARYDGIRHTWGNLNIFIDGLKMGRLKASTLLIYNGYLKQFEARHFSFTYDLHCAEAILQIIDNPIGFRPGTQVGFFIRLKALPFDTPFGIGRRGQSYGTGTGYGY